MFVALVMSWIRAWGIDVEVDQQECWGPEFGGENSEHLAKLDTKYYPAVWSKTPPIP